MNRRELSDKLGGAFPNVLPVERPVVKDQSIRDPNWLVGFVSGEGCFLVKVYDSPESKFGKRVWLEINITQHSRDSQLIESLVEYLNCGKVYKARGVVNFVERRFSHITEKIIPFFDKYPLIGVKSKDFDDFKKVALLMKEGSHKTKEGLEQIEKIKLGMNRGRE